MNDPIISSPTVKPRPSAGKSWQQTKSENTRLQILEATLYCFSAYGFHKTTTEKVSKQAKVSRGAMLHHFSQRAELVRAAVEHLHEKRLQEYERFKKAAEDLEAIPRLERELWQASAAPPDLHLERPQPDVAMREVLLALGEVLRRAEMYVSHQVQLEALSTRERMSQVLETLRSGGFVPFVTLFTPEEGRLGVVVTFLALMELMKESLIEIVQTEGFGPIHVKAKSE